MSHPSRWVFSLLPLLLGASLALAAAPDSKTLALGERMYREGLLPSGKPMQAVARGGQAVPGTVFTCVSCHQRSGLGSTEEGIAALPVSGPKLYQSLERKFSKIATKDMEKYGLTSFPLRPAYTDATLARAIREGIDPTGRHLNPVMPPYALSEADMDILIAYLKQLSAKTSPGADDQVIHFATVIAGEVRPEDREAMLVPLRNWVQSHNAIAGNFNNKMYTFGNGPEMQQGYRQVTVDTWELKGPPGTWDAQLRAYAAARPTFALLSGLTYGPWQPIHDFCEAAQIPCLFPLTDFPVLGEKGWYTLYLSKGYAQEGETAARYLHNALAANPAERVLQVIQDTPAAKALAASFQDTWQELQGRPLRTVTLSAQAVQDPAFLTRLLAKEAAGTVLLWAGAETYPAVASLAASAAAPARLFLSAGLLQQELDHLPGAARPITYLTYPYRHPEEEPTATRLAYPLMAGLTALRPERRIATRVFTLTRVLTTALMDMDQNLYRDNLLDVIGMQPDQALPDYERVSFGPGQRFASKGCYIMQLTQDPKPRLVKKTAWITY